ncbi:MAG: tRNA (adenosine(37)-N6)-threonylcarbamoyltransferase complex transferase subunit TsaD [Dehalococcoidales bacterium]|nr:tRNA (adenosine(37)-N6)-threonylcarbamoyltransferase complex transferase subunit TsaD [Dehalococcoidales bacterium]
MKILGIESSCDETAAAVVEDGTRILSSVIASQVEIHARYGGVVPEVASRQHILSIIPVIQKAMEDAYAGWEDIDGIAVTIGPGLAGSLLVGASTAKAIAGVKGLPLIGVNHLEAHIYANWLAEEEPVFPLLCLIVSGGHSDLVLMKGHGDYIMLGRTRDDAAGEAFDKAARIMGLGYPGGPAIDKASENGKPCIDLPHSWIKGTNDFSFSGIKTYLQKMNEDGKINKEDIADLAASFQNAVVDVLVGKTIEAALQYDVRQILLSGGVSANRMLRRRIVEKSHVPVLIPKPVFCTDNAAMVASCGYFHLITGRISNLDVDVVPGLKLV